MEEVFLARIQFGVTSTYHFLFVPLTLGLSILIAIMEFAYVRSGSDLYKKMAQFWGKLFVINFAMGIVTGIVQEFHFGMNWSEYARFMGDIFGAPLALEALTAFFLESVFLGLWIFGWDRIPRMLHAAAIAIVAFASNLSAFWILVANSFMQSPVGYALRNGRAEMTDLGALLTNPYVLHQYPHVFFSGLATAGVFVVAISAYHLLRKSQIEFFRASMRIGLVCALVSTLMAGATGHSQAQFLAKAQPMKLAAMEALWETADPAPFALGAVIDEKSRTNTVEVAVPGMLSALVHNSLAGEVKGIKDLQDEYVRRYGPGNYIPPVTPVFWSFRIMVAAGSWLVLIMLAAVFLWRTGRLEHNAPVLKALTWTLPFPYIANSAGWFVTEAGRQPWIVFGLQRVEQAASPVVSAGSIWVSLIGFTLIYGLLASAAIYLLRKFALKGPVEHEAALNAPETKGATLWS